MFEGSNVCRGGIEKGVADILTVGILTQRQRDILDWVKEGKTNFEIAAITGISENTVRTHLKRIFMKLEVHSKAQAVAAALQIGVL